MFPRSPFLTFTLVDFQEKERRYVNVTENTAHYPELETEKVNGQDRKMGYETLNVPGIMFSLLNSTASAICEFITLRAHLSSARGGFVL